MSWSRLVEYYLDLLCFLAHYPSLLHHRWEQSSLNNPWKFAAGYLDSSTGLYKFGTRYYDPTLGRWTQQDPVGGSLGDLNSANRYVYAGDDPINVVDPSGKDCVADFFFIIAGLASAAWSTFQLLGGIGAILASSPVGLAGMAAEVTFTGVPIAEILTVLFIVIGVAAAAYAFVVALNQCLGLNVVAPL